MTSHRFWCLPFIWLAVLACWQSGNMPRAVRADVRDVEAVEEDEDDGSDLPDRPLYLQKPFDLITVKVDGSKHKIVPLELPERRVTMQTSGTLRVRLLSEPAEERMIRWSNIERIDLFEDLVLAEARELTRQRRYDEAFRYFAFLQDKYPRVAGLERTIQDFLFVNAGSYVGEKRFPEALTTLDELYERNRNYVSAGGRPLTSALSAVIGTLLRQYIDAGDYPLARSALRRFQQRYGDGDIPALGEGQRRLEELARNKGREVRRLLDNQQWREAEIAAREMLRIWPTVEGGVELAREALQRYAIVPVAVMQRAERLDVASATDWGARRAGRLVSRQLVELQSPGPEGGRYTSPLGTIERGDDYQEVAFQVPVAGANSSSPPPVSGYEISERLLELADLRNPQHVPGWAEIVDRVRVAGVWRAEARLRRPHVVPEAFLQVPLFDPEREPEWARTLVPYDLTERTEDSLRFTSRSHGSEVPSGGAPAEIREIYYEESDDALAALERGDVFLVDRLFPADAARLSQDEMNRTVRVGRYALPTIHLLIPNEQNPYLNNPTFRRAILHAIPREGILERLLDGHAIAGCRVITGPFPAGRSADDPIAYGYDHRLDPRPFDPGVALLLFRMAESQLRQAAEKNDQEPPELKPLVLAHPEDAMARFACTMIARQLNQLQIPCQVMPLPAGQATPDHDAWDLLYATVSVGEPILDAERILARGGLASPSSPYIALGLRRLRQARTWREVRDRLLELHQLAYSEVTVLPLWQLVEHYAYRNNLRGVGDQAVTLYQEVEQWRVEPVLPAE